MTQQLEDSLEAKQIEARLDLISDELHKHPFANNRGRLERMHLLNREYKNLTGRDYSGFMEFEEWE